MSVEKTLEFFEKAVPAPEDKNRSTQLGCHFEEVREMILELQPTHQYAEQLLFNASRALHDLANYLKQNENAVELKDSCRTNFLDALCDQMVTAVGCAHMFDMDIIGGFNEVAESNLSKFDERGEPIFDENHKVMKGPNYVKANLDVFATPTELPVDEDEPTEEPTE